MATPGDAGISRPWSAAASIPRRAGLTGLIGGLDQTIQIAQPRHISIKRVAPQCGIAGGTPIVAKRAWKGTVRHPLPLRERVVREARGERGRPDSGSCAGGASPNAQDGATPLTGCFATDPLPQAESVMRRHLRADPNAHAVAI